MHVPRTVRSAVLLGLLTTAAMLGATAAAAAQGDADPSGGWVNLSASGSGEDEAPAGSGEKGTTCAGTFSFDEAGGELVYAVKVRDNGEEVTAAHLHRGGFGEIGDVVVELDAAAVSGEVQGTAEVDPAVVARIVDDPENYYLNVHSESFAPPSGVCRAQLASVAERPDVIDTGGGGAAADGGPSTGLLAGGAVLVLLLGAAALRPRATGGDS
jgi:hypothetical protein